MSDTLYNARQFVSFDHKEFWGLVLTSIVAAFTLSARDLLFVRFGEAASLWPFALTFVFLFFLGLVAVWVSKILAARIGYVIQYRPHKAGLIIGVFLAIILQGFLPFFLPGGYRFDKHNRMLAGKFQGWYKGWEVGVISATYPIMFTIFLLPLNALYLATHDPTYSLLILASWLTALFACLPAPMIEKHQHMIQDWIKTLRGASFGLDVYIASGPWFIALCAYVLLVGLFAWFLSLAALGVALVFYGLSFLLALVIAFLWRKFLP